MSKTDKYQTREDIDELENLSERLALDLRKHIRGLGSHSIYSDAWCEMAETCGRIAKISDMEATVAASKNDATLWETEEQALRYLLEDGKLNLCLRNIIDYKTLQRQNIITNELPTIGLLNSGDDFEKGIGTVLRNAWNHVEALQTTDIPGLITHIAEVLQFCLSNPAYLQECIVKNDVHQRQEVLVFSYLTGILQALSNMDESRAMPFVREKGIFSLGLHVVVILHDSGKVPSGWIFKCCVALSMLVDTDDFTTYTSEHIGVNDLKDGLELQAFCMKEFQGDSASRNALRPLLDAINKLKRQASRK